MDRGGLDDGRKIHRFACFYFRTDWKKSTNDCLLVGALGFEYRPELFVAAHLSICQQSPLYLKSLFHTRFHLVVKQIDFQATK